jgi:hypothetical protein
MAVDVVDAPGKPHKRRAKILALPGSMARGRVTMLRQVGLAVPDRFVHHRAQDGQRRRSPALPIDGRKIQMSTPWDKLSGDAYEAELRGDVEKAWELRHIAEVLEIGAERAAKAETRRAGSNAFRSDAEEEKLREENQSRFYGGGRGR